MCGVAGALYVPQVGIINPSEMTPAELDRDRDLGGGRRARHPGRPGVGRLLVNGAKSWFTAAFPEYWLFFLGALFVPVTLFLAPAASSACAAPQREES